MNFGKSKMYQKKCIEAYWHYNREPNELKTHSAAAIQVDTVH
jgi:hypothetical protein